MNAMHLHAHVNLSVEPRARVNGARAWPIGAPKLLPCPRMSAIHRGSETDYLVRQAFIAEIPFTVGTRVRASDCVAYIDQK